MYNIWKQKVDEDEVYNVLECSGNSKSNERLEEIMNTLVESGDPT